MPDPVRYRCPRCGTVVTLQRAGYLADKSVTPYPLEGWTYVDADAIDEADSEAHDGDEPSEPDGVSASKASGGSSNRRFDGVRIVCGEGESRGGERTEGSRTSSVERSESDGVGCGEPFYLSFVRFEDGREVEPDPEPEYVELADPDRPRGPRWPGGPGR